MFSCLAAALYIHRVDIWEQDNEINPETNEIERTWKFLKSVDAYVFPYLEGGLRGMGTTEVFNERYTNSDFLRMKSLEEMDKRWRVTNIRNTNGVVIYQEHINFQPTVYNIDGSAPRSNPLTGEVDEWITALSRPEVQSNG